MTLQSALRYGILFFVCAVSASVFSQVQEVKKLYCWDEGGVRVCGDALPPEAVDRARVEINSKTGMRSGEIERALTIEEFMAAQERERIARATADAEAVLKRRELAMAESYDTEADLRRAYGFRIALVEESLKTSHLTMSNLRQSLLSLLRKAAELELQSQPVAKSLLDSIQEQHADLLRQATILKQQTQEYASLDSELLKALKRYRELKAPKTQAKPAASTSASMMPTTR